MSTTTNPSGTTPAQPSIHPETSIGHVHLKVADLPRAIAFYRDRPREEWPRDADGSFALINAPLDVRALLRELDA